MKITDGIYRVDGVRGANCYLVAGQERMLLIDSGLPGNADRIIRYIQALGGSPASLEYLVLTHADIDHAGSAAEVKRLSGAKIAIHASDASTLAGEKGSKALSGLPGLIFKLMPLFFHFQPVKPDILLQEGMEIADFKVVFAPGHTAGSICLYGPGKVIFAGDALRSDASGNLKLPSALLSADMAQARASLVKLSQLEFDLLLPGHGTPVTGGASDRLKKLVAGLNKSE